MRQLNLHSIFLNLIKKEVGASFSAIEKNKDKFYVKIIRNKETSLFEMVGNPEQATPDTYMDVMNQIKEYYNAG